MYVGKTMFEFLAIFVDKSLICGDQFMFSSTNIPRNVVFDLVYIITVYSN